MTGQARKVREAKRAKERQERQEGGSGIMMVERADLATGVSLERMAPVAGATVSQAIGQLRGEPKTAA